MNWKNKELDKKWYTVYKTTNLINGKIYIGFHSTDNLEDGYLGSGKILKRAIKKYGTDNFEKEIIEVFDNQKDAEDLEAYIVNEDFVKRKDNYYITVGGNVCILTGSDNGFYGKIHTKDTLDRIQESRKWFTNHTEETKKRISKTLKSIWTNDRKEWWSKKRTGKFKHSEETKEKMSELLTGRIFTEEHKKKISESRITNFNKMSNEEYTKWYEQSFSEEANKNRSISQQGKKCPWNEITNKNPEKIRKTADKHKGMKRSEDSKRKMSIAAKKRSPINKGKVYCYHPETLDKKLCLKEEIPDGWIRGFVPKTK